MTANYYLSETIHPVPGKNMTLESLEEESIFPIFGFLAYCKKFEGEILQLQIDTRRLLKEAEGKGHPGLCAIATSEHNRAHIDFPFLLRYGFVLSVYSHFEASAKRLCTALRKKDPSYCIPFGALKGDLVSRLRIYLVDLGRLNLQFSKRDCWTLLEGFSLLRHCLVHCNGNIKEFSDPGKRLRRLVQSRPDLNLTVDGFITIEPAFCPEIAETIGDFFNEIFLALEVKGLKQPFPTLSDLFPEATA